MSNRHLMKCDDLQFLSLLIYYTYIFLHNKGKIRGNINFSISDIFNDESLDVKTILMENKPRVIKIVCTVIVGTIMYGGYGSKIARDRNHIILLLN